MLFKNYWLWLLSILAALVLLTLLVPNSWQYAAAPSLCACTLVLSLKRICDRGFGMRHIIGYPIGLVICLVGIVIGLAGKNSFMANEISSLIVFNGMLLAIIFSIPIILFILLILPPKTHESI